MKGGSQHMRKALLFVVSVLALAGGAVALAAVTRVVAIKPAGFSPVTRTIQTGDSIRWRNDDTVDHQVVAMIRESVDYWAPFIDAGRADLLPRAK